MTLLLNYFFVCIEKQNMMVCCMTLENWIMKQNETIRLA